MHNDKAEYTRSILNIDIKFEATRSTYKPEDTHRSNLTLKKLSVIPSNISKSLEDDIRKRQDDIIAFRKQAHNAVLSPLLAQALVKKTEHFLDSLPEIESRRNLLAIEKFRKAARLIFMLCSITFNWRKYDTRIVQHKTPPTHDRIRLQNNIFLSLHSKVSSEMRHLLTTLPQRRDDDMQKKIVKILQKLNITKLFPEEKETFLGKYAAYGHFDAGRILTLQDGPSQYLYFIVSGLIAKVKVIEFAEGVSKHYVGEMRKGSYTDINETLKSLKRKDSLICQTDVEVILFERCDVITIFNNQEHSDRSNELLLQSISLLKSYPVDKLVKRGGISTHYYAKKEIIEEDINTADCFYIVKTGSCQIKQRCKDVFKNNLSKTKQHATPNIIQTESLEKRGIFGMETLLQRALHKVQSVVSEDRIDIFRELQGRVESILESQGAELIIVDKTIFLNCCDFVTLTRLISYHIRDKEKPSDDISDIHKWKSYKSNLVQDIIRAKRQ